MSTPRKNRIIVSAQIRNVRLLKIDATGPRPGLVVSNQEANINVNYNGGLIAIPDEQGNYGVIAEFRVQVVPATSTEACFSIVTHFELTYQLPPGFEYADDEMKEFVVNNAPFNAWPYLREIVQSMTARMGLSSITLPLYRHGQALGSETSEEKPAQESEK